MEKLDKLPLALVALLACVHPTFAQSRIFAGW